MAARLTPRVLRLTAFAAVALLSTATLTSAAGDRRTATARKVPKAQPVVRVPDVRGQVFVFAKGMLADAGFAWRVSGPVHGYAANVVASQSPAPGTRVVDNGSPTVAVTLTRSAEYAEEGMPEDRSPYTGTVIVLPSAQPAAKPKPAAKPNPAPKPKPAAKPRPVAKPRPAAKPKPSSKPEPAKPARASERKPAFVVPGAPKEPLDEMTLPTRARKLEAWLARNPKPTDANVRHWFYQHEWIVTGAKFGWSQGDEALRILIRVDDRVIELWGVGSRSRATAVAALREVEAKTR